MLEEDSTAICGRRYAQEPDRPASRASTTRSEVVLGGRRDIPVRLSTSHNEQCCQVFDLEQFRYVVVQSVIPPRHYEIDRQPRSKGVSEPDGAIRSFAVHLPDCGSPRQLSSPGESAQLQSTQRIGLVSQDLHRFRQRRY